MSDGCHICHRPLAGETLFHEACMETLSRVDPALSPITPRQQREWDRRMKVKLKQLQRELKRAQQREA